MPEVITVTWEWETDTMQGDLYRSNAMSFEQASSFCAALEAVDPEGRPNIEQEGTAWIFSVFALGSTIEKYNATHAREA